MKPTFTIALLPIVASLTACERETAETPPPLGGIVAFAGSGITLSPGDGWKQIEISAGPGQCPPTLVGTRGMIQVLVLPPERSDPQVAVAGLRAAFDTNPRAVKDSFKEGQFVTESGLQGFRVSYFQNSEKDGQLAETRSYNYIVRNREGRGVGVNYIATSKSDSDEVHQMIRRSLTLQ